MLALQFGFAINAGWRGGVGLDIGRALRAVEHVIGRDMDEGNSGARAKLRQTLRACDITGERRVTMRLGRVHGGIGRGIDHQRRLRGGKARIDGVGCGKIQFGPADRPEIQSARFGQSGQRMAELPGAACDQNHG